jgi:hypothetical protein
VTITTAGWGGGPITTWGWGGWGGLVPPPPPPPPQPTGPGSWISHDPEWEHELLHCFDEETIQRVYDSLASLLALQQAATKAQEDQLIRNAFALAFSEWRKRAVAEARRMLGKPMPEDHTALLDWCLKTEKQVGKWLRAFKAEVREFGAPPESILTEKRKAKAKAHPPQILVEDYSTKDIAKRIAVGAAKVVAVRIAISLIWKMLAALEIA